MTATAVTATASLTTVIIATALWLLTASQKLLLLATAVTATASFTKVITASYYCYCYSQLHKSYN